MNIRRTFICVVTVGVLSVIWVSSAMALQWWSENKPLANGAEVTLAPALTGAGIKVSGGGVVFSCVEAPVTTAKIIGFSEGEVEGFKLKSCTMEGVEKENCTIAEPVSFSKIELILQGGNELKFVSKGITAGVYGEIEFLQVVGKVCGIKGKWDIEGGPLIGEVEKPNVEETKKVVAFNPATANLTFTMGATKTKTSVSGNVKLETKIEGGKQPKISARPCPSM